MSKWEDFDEASNASTSRMKVDGGYLYHVGHFTSNSTAVCFVPDVDLTRYQAHLRDAYKKGYLDGQLDAKQGLTHEIEA